MEIGLALSGGGFRATLFHLGIVKALLDRKVLKDVRHITSVSGGSILAAHLVLHWREYNDPATFEKIARKIIDFTRSDVRGRVFRRLILPPYLLLPYWENLRHFPPRFRRDGTVRNLLFERDLLGLYGDVLLRDLAEKSPDAPRLDILTTNLTQGSLAYFSNGVLVANDDQPVEIETPITVGRAVMASALFPGVFPTVELTAENLMVDPEKFAAGQYFTDGGVYDNLGIRRFQTVLQNDDCKLDSILVSDASGAFGWLVETETLGYWKTALRSSEVFMKRLADLECDLAGGRNSSDQFKFLRISDVLKEGMLSETVQEQIKNIRTDLDRFSVSEVRALVLHGYEIAAGATSGWTDVPDDRMRAWDPFAPVKNEPEARWVRQLRRARFHPWGLFRSTDWPSYVYPTLMLLALLVLVDWYLNQRLHWHFAEQTRVSGEILESVPEPDETASLVRRAVRRPHRNQEHRLEATLFAYALYLQRKDVASKQLVEEAKENLDASRLERFHEAKWKHFYSKLPSTTFGFPESAEVETALAFAEDAVNGLPPQSPAHVEVALTSYGVFSKPTTKKEDKDRAFGLLRQALDRLDKTDPKALNDSHRFRAAQLRGHYFLEVATTAEADAGKLKGEVAARKYCDAEDNYQRAANTYEAARDLRFKGLWSLHYNVCNAMSSRAAVARNYIAAKESMSENEKKQIERVIADNLLTAEQHCKAARDLLPPTDNNWQPTYVLAFLELKQDKRREAARHFVEGYKIAERSKEHADYAAYLATEADAKTLCDFVSFHNVFVNLCRGS